MNFKSITNELQGKRNEPYFWNANEVEVLRFSLSLVLYFSTMIFINEIQIKTKGLHLYVIFILECQLKSIQNLFVYTFQKLVHESFELIYMMTLN